MGVIYADIRLSNAAKPELEELTVTALVDSDAIDLVIPEALAAQLHLGDLTPREVRLADGRRRTVRYVGPVLVRAHGRDCMTSALVTGDQVLLGAIPMEAMDMIVHPRLQQLVPNPENPELPGALLMAAMRAEAASCEQA